MFRATKSQQNYRKCWKNSNAHSWRASLNNPRAHRNHWDQLWSLPGDLRRKCECAPHCHRVCSPTLDKWQK
jgi:hypothetical protein